MQKQSKSPVDIGCECDNCLQATIEWKHLEHVIIEKYLDHKKCSFCKNNAKHLEIIYECDNMYDVLYRKYLIYKLFGEIVDYKTENSTNINAVCLRCYLIREKRFEDSDYNGIARSYFPSRFSQ